MTVISVRYGNRLHLLNESLFDMILQCFFSLAVILSTVAYVEAGLIQVVKDVLC